MAYAERYNMGLIAPKSQYKILFVSLWPRPCPPSKPGTIFCTFLVVEDTKLILD
jgi:hypothetical protein